MRILKCFKFRVKYSKDDKTCYRIDREFSTYLSGAIRKWQQNNSNATIVGIVEA